MFLSEYHCLCTRKRNSRVYTASTTRRVIGIYNRHFLKEDFEQEIVAHSNYQTSVHDPNISMKFVADISLSEPPAAKERGDSWMSSKPMEIGPNLRSLSSVSRTSQACSPTPERTTRRSTWHRRTTLGSACDRLAFSVETAKKKSKIKEDGREV